MVRKVIDIESNDLLAEMLDYRTLPYRLKPEAKLWCVVITNIDTGESVSAVKEEITKEWMYENLKDCDVLVAHNGVKFDFLVLWLFGLIDYKIGYLGENSTLFGKPITFIDTLILSRLFNPDRKDGHSLEAWGKRTGNFKMDFRELCIEKGYIQRTDPKGAEFKQYVPEMEIYCRQDTFANIDTFLALEKEWKIYDKWDQAITLEHKLADLGIRRETFGFWFDKDLALWCLEDLSTKIKELTEKVNPHLPPKPMNKGELNAVTPPKRQLNKYGELTTYIKKFAEEVGATLEWNDQWYISYKGYHYQLPYYEPLETEIKANIDDMDHVKMHLISLGWSPTEWRERDLTIDSKKQKLPYEKRLAALKRWLKDTEAGKYKESRLKIVGLPLDEIYPKFAKRLKEDKPVKVPTSPTVRVGLEKELCPNLIKLGDKVAFAKDFALFLTYRSRKNTIAGGLNEDEEFDPENVNTGFLSMYREEDGRIPTPAIEIGTNTTRYKHIGVANIARATSVYGKEMRSLFGSGPLGLELGYDYSSLENRIQGIYVYKYDGGPELAQQLIAEKPNDLHSLNAIKFNMKRADVKSLAYGILYGSQPPKIAKMLACDLNRAKEIYNQFWDSVPALKSLKENLEKFWESTGKTYILGIDGRKIMTRSKHSLLNSLFQSGGVICVKYTNVFTMQLLEQQGYCIDPFKGTPDICEMIAYHDENQYFIQNKFFKYESFDSEEKAKEFIINWKGEGQLSAISHGKSWYVALPNAVSKAIDISLRKTEKTLNLKLPLGYEWVINKTWFGCH